MQAMMMTATATVRSTATETAQSTKLSTRDKVILEHLPLVKAIAARVRENLPVHVDLDDLVHAGILGLFDAVNKFDPDKQVAFSSYAKHRIKGAMLDELRAADVLPRGVRDRVNAMKSAHSMLERKLGRMPEDSEVAAALGVTLDDYSLGVAARGRAVTVGQTSLVQCPSEHLLDLHPRFPHVANAGVVVCLAQLLQWRFHDERVVQEPRGFGPTEKLGELDLPSSRRQ